MLFAAPALADDFTLPGLDSDAARYEHALRAKFPAGGTIKQKAASEQAADAALKSSNWPAEAAALEDRIGEGDPTAAQWLALAQAMMKRQPPDPTHALRAAWRAYNGVDDGTARIPPLLIMVDALRAQHRDDQALLAMQAVVERAPDDAGYKTELADIQKAVGMIVGAISTDVEADPPRACIGFTIPLTHRLDFHPADWVTLDPPVPDAAVTHEGDQLCVSGLPLGATTTVTLRAGLPAQAGLTLQKDSAQAIAMGDRAARLTFDDRLFLLPRGQATKVTLTTINLSSVALKLARISERALGPYAHNNHLGDPIDYTGNITDDAGSVVWTGHADIPSWKKNQAARTAVPLPEVLGKAGPGLYALIANPDDGSVDRDSLSATQLVLRTDLAPTVWRGRDGLTVQLRSFADAKPVRAAAITLIARNNDILGEAATDDSGVARFPAPLLHGDGPLSPVAIHISAGDDFTQLDLERAAFDLSDRGVEGQAQPGALDAFLYTDRGIYRPGETVQLMGLVRDSGGAPADMPAHLRIKRPNGQIFLDTLASQTGGASIYQPVKLSLSAPRGTWTAELYADPDAPPIGEASFRVDAFVPDRMAVDFGAAHGPIVPGQPYELPLTARYLYGAPAANLSGKGDLQLSIDPTPFPEFAAYSFGLASEPFAPDHRDLALPDTDADGRATLTINLKGAPDITHPLQAAVHAEVNDPSGHAAGADLTLKVQPAGHLLGIKEGFDGSVDAGSPAVFDIAALSPQGKRIATKASLRLVRERPDWRLVMHGSLARYETVWHDEPVVSKDIAIAADHDFHFEQKLDFGAYRLEIVEAGGLAASSVRFSSGWSTSSNPDVPDKVTVSSDRKSYQPGETATIHIAAPFAGEASVLVLTDRVLSVTNTSVEAGGTDVPIKTDAAWGPGAYVAVHVFHAAAGGEEPSRAIGLTWVALDPSARKLDLAITAPDKTVPRAQAAIAVKTEPGAWVSLAAVDEGILRLTSFVAPDPTAHFTGRRTLGIDIRDDWGRLIPPAQGEATTLRQGGDGAAALSEIPQKTVTLFVAPVQAGADGIAKFPLDIPDFEGQVRLMAVGWSGRKIGAASLDMIVRDALVAEPLLPRFLAPGDETRLAILLHNLDLPSGEAAATVSVEGPLAVDPPARVAATLAPGASATPSLALHATGVGRGQIHLDVTGPGGFHIRRDTAILVRPARGPVTTVIGGDLPVGTDVKLPLSPADYVPGTFHGSATFGGATRYDAAGLVRALDDYPLSCLEQATSRGFPLAFFPDGPIAGPDRAGRLQSAVQLVLDRQRFDGGFGLWSASGDAEPWLTAYATEFLLRARDAGAAVPEQALADALKFVGDGAADTDSDPKKLIVRVYDLYDLALAGKPRAGAERVLFEQLDSLPTPLAKAQLAAALARTNDKTRAEAAFAAALDQPARKWWYLDYGTALRDQVATALLLRESGLLQDRLPKLLSMLPGADFDPRLHSTQEMAWAAAAAGALGRSLPPAHVAIDGEAQSGPLLTISLSKPTTARNLGDRTIWQSVSATGVPLVAPPASRSAMRITRKFFNTDGTPLDLDHLHQNTSFILLFEGRADDAQEHQAMLLQGLPAGWEIESHIPAGDVAGMKWLGTLTDTDSEPATDDRYAAVMTLPEDKPDFRLAVRLRAVTPGNYEIPGAELSDMYRPGVYARQASNRIAVLPP